MSQLSVDQKNIKDLLQSKKSDFLIPDYQRPYAWGEDECEVLWEDLFTFAFPNDDETQFDSQSDEYFLGPIVTFENEDGKLEIIDGQQRLTTILLLLRALYDKFAYMKDNKSKSMHTVISRCVWRTNEFDEADKDQLKIDSEVASDDDKDELVSILRSGIAENGWKSRYATNYRFFQEQISKLVNEWPSYTPLFAARLLNNVILLPIEADSQDTALRIFSTLNDRGLPLSDADIFKSQFYKFFSARGKKDDFIERWKRLEEGAGDLFGSTRGTPMDELFTRYMYFRRAKEGIKDTTLQSLRDFYSRDAYTILKSDETLADLEALFGFWKRVSNREGLSERAQRALYVLSYAPNGMWAYITSVWFLANRDEQGLLDDESFCSFLDLLTAFAYAYAIERPGVNALRGPGFAAMVDIVRHRPVSFSNHTFERDSIRQMFSQYEFTNQRPVTKSILVWWAYQNPNQELFAADQKLDIEHIYARKRDEVAPLSRRANLESLGNKAILEKEINIRAADYRFEDKRAYYTGERSSRRTAARPTKVRELLELADECSDFNEGDIEKRKEAIIDGFVAYLEKNGLLEQ